MQDTRCRMQDRASGRAEFKPASHVRISKLNQDAYPVCGFFEGRCRVPGTGFGVRPSALGLDKGGGKVVPPSPLIPPWPRAGYRGPSRGTGYLAPGTRYLSRSDTEDRTPSAEDRARLMENAHTGYARCRIEMSGFGLPGTRNPVPGTPAPFPHFKS
jgi:hypothetical protein